MTFTRAATGSSSASSATQATTITSSAAGCVLVVNAFSAGNHTVSSVSDNVNGSTGWTQAASAAAVQGSARVSDIWYHLNPGAGVTTVTITWSVSDATNKEAVVMEFQPSGAVTFDTANHLNDIASSTSQTGAAATPTTANSTVVSCLRTAGVMTGASGGSGGFTVPTNGLTANTNGAAYEFTTATSSQAATFSSSSGGAACSSILVLKETAGATSGGPVFDGRTFHGLTLGRVLRAPMLGPMALDRQLRRAA